jgi:hypothetical protein
MPTAYDNIYRRTENVYLQPRQRCHANLKDACYLKIPKYTAYHTNHPAGIDRGRTTIIIKSSIQHHQLSNYSQDFLKAISVTVEDTIGLLYWLFISHPNTQQEQLEDFYNTLWHQLIAGDYNAGDPDSYRPEDVKYSKQ